ncbi:MAG TPA: TIR domain-containing protein, partial [Methylomirabilota bacterium]|nr:TIR domain-containing protein [Methylomirabilota bacterium]
MSSEQKRPVHVFFSYARRDKTLRERLEEHLSILKYQELITTWHNRDISAGEDWIQQIDIHLDKADIILLLISSSFIASEYCYSKEMKRALERHETKEARVVPILLRPVVYDGAPFARLQFLPTNKKPVVTWPNRDSAFVDIALGIRQVVEEFHAPKTSSNKPFPPADPASSFIGQPNETPGSRLQGGRYVVRKMLGQGGMGAALLATDLRLDSKPVVLKELISDNTDPSKMQEDVRNF